MSMAQRHNKQLGLMGDVLAPVMRVVMEVATARPPAVHPFTVGGAPRKDEYQAAWRSLAKRNGVSLLAPGEGLTAAGLGVGGIRGGRLASGAPLAVVTSAEEAAKETAPQPTHVQMYGATALPLQQVQFAEALASWLGTGPIDLQLLAPGAPPLSLRRLFTEVHEAGGSAGLLDGDGGTRGNDGQPGPCGSGKREGQSWKSLADKLQGDGKLGVLLRQVYDAYLMPLERRMPRSTRPARVEAWMQEDLRRRGALLGGRLAPSAEQVSVRLKAACAAVLSVQQLQLQRRQPLHGIPAQPTDAAGQDTAATAVEAAVGTGPDFAAATTVAQGTSTGGQPPLAGSLSTEVMQALRMAAVAAPTLLPGAATSAGGSKRTSASNRGGRGHRGNSAGSRKRVRDNAAGPGSEAAKTSRDGSAGPEAVAGIKPTMGTVSQAGAVDGGDGVDSAVPNLTDPKAAALLSVVASLRELRAGPPGCATRPPDLRANFMARWEELHAERAAAEAVAAAAAAAAASVPAGSGTLSGAVAAGAVCEQEQYKADPTNVEGASWGGGAREQMEELWQGQGLAGMRETADGYSKGQQREPRQAKRQRRVVAEPMEAAAEPRSLPLHQQLPERRSGSPRATRQQAPSPRGQCSRQREQSRERPRSRPPPPTPQQQQRERELPRNRSAGAEWRRPSPYHPPPPHNQSHWASSSAVPLVSAAATSHDFRSALPPLLPPLSSHRPMPPPPLVPPAVQQHLGEMRRHTYAHSRPHHGIGGGGGDYYEWLPPAGEWDCDQRGPRGGLGYGPEGPGRPHPYPRRPEGGGWEEDRGWDRGSERGWDYGGPRGLL